MKRSVNVAWLGGVRVGRRRILVGGEEGAALYELAWALPILLAVLVGIIYGGVTFYDYETLVQAVAAGARTLATSATTEGALPCTLASNMVYASAGTLNKISLVVQNPPTFGPLKSTCTVSTGTVTVSGLKAGDTATLTATYPCFFKVPLPWSSNLDLCPKGDLLTASTTVVIE
jgi:Flp pilus assembly protein TadG